MSRRQAGRRRMSEADSGRPPGVAPHMSTDEQLKKLVDSVTDYAILLLDAEGRVRTWTPGAVQILGYAGPDIIGRHFSEFYTAAAVERGWPAHELAVARVEGRFEDEGWRIRSDQKMFWANVIITALRDDAGTVIGFGKIIRDMTERRRVQESLRQSEERFRLLVDSVQDYAIFMLDPDGRVSSWNTGAERIKGYTAQEIIGQHFSVFYLPDARAVDWPSHELRVARSEGRYEEEGWRLRSDGSRFWANVVITAVYDRAGELRGYAKITRDLTQRQRMQALQDASRQMSEFLAMLAHELRNPLAPMRNAMQVMGLRKLDDPQLEWCRDVVDRQVSHLGRLVDDLLDVNRITTGKILLKRESIELAAVLERAVESSAPLLQERKHTLDIRLPDEPLRVQADSTRLSQVFLNLLNNAAKYTPEGGVVRVNAHAEGEEAVVSVSDNGVGIPHELLPKVFDLFVQGSRSLDRADGGLGIGLTLVREILRLHGGSITASSRGAGAGSKFEVRLPLEQPASHPVEHADDARRSAPHGGRRVLVVDDNRDSAESMAMLLRATGHDVETAYDGPTALEAALRDRPEYVLLDIGLPGMSGYAVAERLRAAPALRRMILIAMTGYGQEEDRRRSREAGFDHHLVKPVDFDVLASILSAGEASHGATG
jgi:PAS domain S-box-containing protein